MTELIAPPGGPGAENPYRLKWMPRFLAVLEQGGTVLAAARAAGIYPATAYSARGNHRAFDAAWRAAVASEDEQPVVPPAAQPQRSEGRDRHWRSRFLEALAETSNVRLSAEQAGVSFRDAYKARRCEPEFATRWQAALLEGYEHLEMEILGHLRSPNPKRKLDVTAALRLLAAHRETVIRLRALAGEEDEQAVRDSIDAFLEGMRQRRLANEAILVEGNLGCSEADVGHVAE
jgi:hypothetical protein